MFCLSRDVSLGCVNWNSLIESATATSRNFTPVPWGCKTVCKGFYFSTTARRTTLPTWGPPPVCKKAFRWHINQSTMISMIKMKRITRRVKVKDSQDEITHKHEGKPDIYLEKFSASGHLFLHTVFPWNQLDIGKCISYMRTHLGRLHYEDKGCLNMDSAGINLPLIGFILNKNSA